MDNIEELLGKLSRPTYIYRMNHSMSQPYKQRLTIQAKLEIHDAVMEYARSHISELLNGSPRLQTMDLIVDNEVVATVPVYPEGDEGSTSQTFWKDNPLT